MWRVAWLTPLALAGVAGCGGSAPTAVITVSPVSGLYDQARTIVVRGLGPGEPVRITARTVRSESVWSAAATFRADRQGMVNLARAAPRSGPYTGVDPMGLIWAQRLLKARNPNPLTLSPSAMNSQTRLTVNAGRRRLASKTFTQTVWARGVTLHVERLRNEGFLGLYFAPRQPVRRPAVVFWGGSEGGFGVVPAEVSLLASHGIPALAVAYFGEPGLPDQLTDIPLEYFVKTVRWLRRQPGVDPNRIWLISGSRGTEAELLVASHWPRLIHGVVAEAPSAFVYPGLCRTPPRKCPAWTLHGHRLPAARSDFADLAYHVDGSVSEVGSFRGGLADKAADRAARIPIGAFGGPVLLISGGDDQLWPSNYYADQIMAELRHDHSTHIHLNFAHAGHIVLDIPYEPASTEFTEGRFVIDEGGTRAADEHAHVKDWPYTLRFIQTH